MATERHHDGGRLRHSFVAHRHVVDHEDGSASAVVMRRVPALACEVCEEIYYEPSVTDTIVALVQQVDVEPGQALAIDYPTVDAA